MTNPADNPTLREQLDAVRPDSEDLRDETLQAAAEALAESDSLRELFHRQQAFDREVASAMQDVAVPEGLKSRLLDSLAAARNEGPSDEAEVGGQRSDIGSDPEFRPPTPDLHASTSDTVSRRSILKWAASAAMLLLAVALGWLAWRGGEERDTLADVRHERIPTTDGMIDITHLPVFDGSFNAELPDSAWRRQVHLTEPKGVDWTGDDQHDGAIYEFRVGRRIHGYLFVLPNSRLEDPPVLTRLSTAGIDYRPVTNNAWTDSPGSTDSGLTYICYVDDGDLQALQRALYPHAA